MKHLLFVALASIAGAASAQQSKGISEQDAAQYRAGAGMGYAKAAELNHFPGPMHVLDLADKLGLSEQQRATTKELMDQHKRQARAIGAALVESERALEGLFIKGSVDEATLARAVRETAALEGEYRLSHLDTHRRMRALLTEEQVKRYDELRGYSSGLPSHKHGH
jgi:Spy/CpxP family protein refolding chaperone